MFLDAFSEVSFARKANMFSVKNVKGNNAVIKAAKNKVSVIIQKKLQPGDEVFVNYGMSYWKEKQKT